MEAWPAALPLPEDVALGSRSPSPSRPVSASMKWAKLMGSSEGQNKQHWLPLTMPLELFSRFPCVNNHTRQEAHS